MPENMEATEAIIREAVSPGFREKLLARGQARAMIWRDGVLPEDTPAFSPNLSYDLFSYGYSLLSHGLRLLENDGDPDLARIAFEHAAGAIEAVIAKGQDSKERDFHRIVAAAAYHLGRFSARAYSLLKTDFANANLTHPERCLAHLILRDLSDLEGEIATRRLGDEGSDDTLVKFLEQIFTDGAGNYEDQLLDEASDDSLMEVLDLAFTDNFMAAMGTAMLAFERGEAELLDAAIARLQVALAGTLDFNLVPQWWCHRLTIYMLRDLWSCSFHKRLPLVIPDTEVSEWPVLRNLFIASMYRRSRAEIELWPSQLDAATRAFNLNDNMVVSLPTSAGKTRIAELCILACLAAGKRVVFVTPLRALSAQTELVLQRTFQSLGKTVSSLYGSIGVSAVDENILRERDIIVATPEKLDFALRNEPSLLDDVGLIVLDEGHMIGLGEREVRYEVQIQRMLKRADAGTRRVICLSAILPEGDKLEDFVAWLTCDKPSGLIQNGWRPTRLRFGEVDWQNHYAQLKLQVGEERPFVPKFLTASIPPIGGRTTPFPKDQRELCLLTAWRLVEDGQTVLIYCPERRSVEPYAKAIVDLNRRGALQSILDADESELETVLAIGAEWFSPDHVLLECLKLGVAVHHGALPTPFRKEVERLLRDGVLKVTISSPTLAQGLNLTATTLIIHGIVRNREVIQSSEFRNVIGRAGRAYIDLEGLVLYPMFDDHKKRRAQWKNLIEDDEGREMESGLLRLLLALLGRMLKKIGTGNLDHLLEYVTNNAAWEFPELPRENPNVAITEKARWSKFMTSLDTAILSLLGEQDVTDEDIEAKLDSALESSLWARRLVHRREKVQRVLKAGLIARTEYVWANSTVTQRRGYFLAGVGLNTGQALDAQADKLAALLVQANSATLGHDEDEAIAAITAFAEIIFEISPFRPDELPGNWREILSAWLKGAPIIALAAGNEDEVLLFIEQGLIYKLPWGMEAVRVRGLTHNDAVGEFTLADFELGVAVAAVEAGSLNISATLLMKSGFSSRLSAIKAVRDTDGDFTTVLGLRKWLESEVVSDLGQDETWPTPESHKLWETFVQGFKLPERQVWRRSTWIAEVDWLDGVGPSSGSALRVIHDEDGNSLVMTPDYEHVGSLFIPVNPHREGVLLVTVRERSRDVTLEYFGPEDIFILAPNNRPEPGQNNYNP